MRSSCSASSGPTAADTPSVARSRAWPSWSTSLAAACVAVIVFCAVRAIVRGYVPLDDNAVTEARAFDVLSSHIPLVGTVSSVSQLGATVNHPGPLLFDILAVPVRLLPDGSGVAIGVGLLHVAAIIGITWCSRRLLGEYGGCLVLAVTAALMWSLGSEALFEAWQPVVPMLPFFLALIASWGLAAGRDEMAVVAVVAISFVLQTHGSYLLLGPAVVAGAVVCRFALRNEVPVVRRPLVVAGGVGLVLWLQPIADQLFRSHNMSTLLTHATSDEEGRALGFRYAVRAAAEVLVKPPLWARPGMTSSLPNTGGMVSTDAGRVFDPDWVAFPLAALGLIGLLGLLGAVTFRARRRNDVVVFVGGVIGLIAVVAAIVSLSRLPIDNFGFTAHKARWLWPIGAYLTSLAFVTLMRLRLSGRSREVGLVAAVAGGIALAATLPTAYTYVSPAQYELASLGPAQRLRDAVGALEGRGVVFLDVSDRAFPDAYNDTIAAEMIARGIPIRVASDYVAAQYGEQRRLDPAAGVDITVRLFVGWDALDIPAVWHVVAVVDDGRQRLALAFSEGLVMNGEPNG